MSKDDFWIWFEQNKTALEEFMSQKRRNYTIYESLSEKLKQFNEFLIPEMTLDREGHFILIISCDGMRQGIPFVEKLTQGVKEYSFNAMTRIIGVKINKLGLFQSKKDLKTLDDLMEEIQSARQ